MANEDLKKIIKDMSKGGVPLIHLEHLPDGSWSLSVSTHFILMKSPFVYQVTKNSLKIKLTKDGIDSFDVTVPMCTVHEFEDALSDLISEGELSLLMG